MFGTRRNRGRGTPGDQYNRDTAQVTGRPPDAPQPEPAAASAPAPQTEQKPDQPAERPLSKISLEYNGMPILILHEIDDGERPQRIEDVIDRWKNMPKANRFDVLSFPRHFYCISRETNTIDMSVEVPEDYAKLAQKEQDERVRAYMAELTGEKPAAPVAGVLTAELINATPTEDLVDLFYNMKREDRQRVRDATQTAIRKRQQEAAARKSGGGSGQSGQSGQAPQPAPRQQSQRQSTPPQTTGGLSATRRRRGG